MTRHCDEAIGCLPSAHLLDLAGRASEAQVEYAVAARLATSIPEQRYLGARATGWATDLPRSPR